MAFHAGHQQCLDPTWLPIHRVRQWRCHRRRLSGHQQHRHQPPQWPGCDYGSGLLASRYGKHRQWQFGKCHCRSRRHHPIPSGVGCRRHPLSCATGTGASGASAFVVRARDAQAEPWRCGDVARVAKCARTLWRGSDRRDKQCAFRRIGGIARHYRSGGSRCRSGDPGQHHRLNTRYRQQCRLGLCGDAGGSRELAVVGPVAEQSDGGAQQGLSHDDVPT